MMLKNIISALIAVISYSPLTAQDSYLGNLIQNLHQNKINWESNEKALVQLRKDAEVAMQLDSFSVTFNQPIPPSGSTNDYYSWAPYLWPNPQSPDGLPYINKDW